MFYEHLLPALAGLAWPGQHTLSFDKMYLHTRGVGLAPSHQPPDGTFPPDNLIVVFNLSFKFLSTVIHLLQVSYIVSQPVSRRVYDEFRILNCPGPDLASQWYLRTSWTVLYWWYWHPDTEDIVRLTSSWHNYISIVPSLLRSILSGRWVVAGHCSLPNKIWPLK